MRLTVLGCAGSFPSATSAASSYLVDADDATGRRWSVLLDLGNGALGPLQRWGDPAALDLIALSHLHADHCADLPVLHVARRYRPDGPLPMLPVWGPVGTAARIAALGGEDPATDTTEEFDVHEWAAAVAVQVGPLTLTPVPMHHSVPCFGVRVSGPSQSDPDRTVTLAYTGDTDAGSGLDELARDADLLLAEAAFHEGRDDAWRGIHLTGARAGDAAARCGVRRLVLTHVPAWNDPQRALGEARAVYDGPVELAEPGQLHRL